jgi:hypothetical protein
MAKVKEILRLSDIWTVDMKQPTKHFALCIDNSDYEASLILGKVYRILRDAKAAKDDLVRIVDESGEDYLYHKSHFVFVDFPKSVAKKILALGNAES